MSDASHEICMGFGDQQEQPCLANHFLSLPLFTLSDLGKTSALVMNKVARFVKRRVSHSWTVDQK